MEHFNIYYGNYDYSLAFYAISLRICMHILFKHLQYLIIIALYIIIRELILI